MDGVLTMIVLPQKWLVDLADRPETGMGYHIVSILLKDGRQFNQVVVVEGRITQIRGLTGIPFSEEEIADVILTHYKWDFNAER